MDISGIADELAEHGYFIVPQFFSQQKALQFYHYAQSLDDSQWQLAAIGRQQQQTINTNVRSDTIHWLDRHDSVESDYLTYMDQLRQGLNRELFMGLFDYEAHLARYRPGAFYKKHLDAFKGRSNRILTTVLYLNPQWSKADGGELVLYGERGEVLTEVLPTLGTMVIFLSDRFVHEVKTGLKERFSITGWFRLNSSISGIIDPPR
ncbi:proline hydroxylase [Aliidiomarina sedimenti]|uniref:Proline hydroxylase n=1 Tax=Aliidiomarina sedimenti TaxID=1933879 RepID=A0ABY0C0G9_9GAMM|nr:2OG-Fe(II) oxygenase [Aliidiomarina sedimenti]RUO30725.1 proline hydroxylase [Aliidiomarina sedimenti]